MDKNKIIMLFAATLFCAASFSQPIASDKVPQKVTAAFKTKFPTVNDAKWGKEPNANYEAKFTSGNYKKRAEFDLNGVWVETETVIHTTEVPKTVSAAVMKQNPGCKITDAEEIQNTGKDKVYEVGCEKGTVKNDYRVTADGKVENIIRKKF